MKLPSMPVSRPWILAFARMTAASNQWQSMGSDSIDLQLVILADASIQSENHPYINRKMHLWIPAFARMTVT